jgi:predicted Zn-dependent protease
MLNTMAFAMKKIQIRLVGCIVLLSFILSGPDASGQDLSMDRKMGAEAALQVEQMIGIYPDSALTAYVNAVGHRLVDALGNTPFNFRFQVVDMAEPNAFALPGGYIYVSRGLLSLINDEAELACVIGHEMIHVTKRHSIKQMKKSILPGLLHIPGAVVGMFNPNLGNIINAPVSLGSELFLSNYSRKQESEADKYGVKLASEAGYDPEKLAVILAQISGDVQILTGEAEKRSYFSSHPFTPKRVEKIDKEIPELNWSRKPYLAQDKKSLFGHFEDVVYGANPAQGIFDSNLFRHPDLNIAIAFPEGWKTMNVPVALAAAHPEGEGQMILQVDPSGASPDSLGPALAGLLKKEYNLDPDLSKAVNIHGFPGWILRLTDDTGQDPIKVQICWLQTGDVLLQIAGVCLPKHDWAVTTTINSFRQLEETERNTITGWYMKTAVAQENETLEALSERTNNQWDLKTTVLKNNLDNTRTLSEGQVLKIAIEESYFGR